MNRRNLIRAALALALVAVGVVAGIALRPTVIPEPSAAPVFTPTEIGFAQDMLAHHNQALTMIASLDPTADPAVRTLAQQIERTQRTEVGELSGWLRLAHAPLIDPTPMSWMHATMPSMPTTAATMPGMATQQELDTLTAARGNAASLLFLQLMQRHHAVGITMSQAADTLLPMGIVKQTARDMITTQGQEAGLMAMLGQSLTPS